VFVNPLLRWLARFYSPFLKIGSNLQSLFLIYLRIIWGHRLFLLGMEKLHDLEGTIKFFTTLNLPAPIFHAYEVGIVEAACGILLILGLASRLAAIPLIIVMVTALSTAHAEYVGNLQFITDPHLLAIQHPYPYLFTGLIVFIFGPGRISLDAWIKRWADKQPKY